MKKLTDLLYVQEEGRLLLHGHGPELTPWCLVETATETIAQSKLIAMFAELNDALNFAQTKIGLDTLIPGRTWHVSAKS